LGGSDSIVSSSGGSVGSFHSSDEDTARFIGEEDEENNSIKKCVPSVGSQRLRSQRPKKSSGLLNSFSRKKSAKVNFTNHSSHPVPSNGGCHLSNLLEEDEPDLRPNSDHSAKLTDIIQANSRDGLTSTADVARMLQENDGCDSSSNEGDRGSRPPRRLSQRSRQSSDLSSFTSNGSDIHNDLDFKAPKKNNITDSKAMLKALGDCPSSHELANVAAIRAKEYIEECLSAEVSVLDRKKWESIPQYSKTDLLVRGHLGKGSFSDAFEVIATVVEEEATVTVESLGTDGEDLDKLIEAKFRGSKCADDEDDLDQQIEAMFGSSTKGATNVIHEEEGDDPDQLIEGDDLDKQIESMFGSSPKGATNVVHEEDTQQPKQDDEGDDLDKQIEAMFGSSPKGAPNVLNEEDPKKPKQDEAEKPNGFQSRRPCRSNNTTNLAGSFCVGTHTRRSSQKRERKVIMAMKCLRPQIRSDAEQFMIGVEDLVHETAMLASLDHPHIIKLYGRAGGCVSNSFRLSDGYFILLDRLKDTLDDRIQRWKKSSDKKAPPSLTHIKTACSIADAMSYLHSKNIIFRDLKPANVGFDSSGVLKLFDFGFAIGVDIPPKSPSMCSGNSEITEESHLLYDRCGTPRYMAPEVGLELGYSLPADVYSFGILLWEICALKKPFGKVKSAAEFHKTVFEKGSRPKLGKYWPQNLTEIISNCWSSFPMERPTMSYVKSMLAAHARELSMRQNNGKDNLQKSSVFRRFTG